jgi:16S rRNA (cytidine1402-2'-O)-methyltransferase
MAGTLFVVATPIGNLEDISARALRVLREATLIAAEDTRHTGHLLQRYGIGTRTVSLHEHNEADKSAALVGRLLAGDHIALVSDAGTPTISDPGAHLIQLAHQNGVRVEPVPGPSAVLAALSASGLTGNGFVFMGFAPTKPGERSRWFDRIEAAAQVVDVAVFYEAPHRILSTLSDLATRFGDLEIALARELTKTHEEVRRARLSALGDLEARGEFTIVLPLSEIRESGRAAVPVPTMLREEFGEMTNNDGLTRRQAISRLSRKYGVSAKSVFDALEAAKSSGG